MGGSPFCLASHSPRICLILLIPFGLCSTGLALCLDQGELCFLRQRFRLSDVSFHPVFELFLATQLPKNSLHGNAMEGVSLNDVRECLGNEIRRMQHYNSRRIKGHYFLEANTNGAVDLFGGFFNGKRQLIVLIAQQFFEFLEFEAVTIHHQLNLLLRVLLAVVLPHCWLIIVQQEIPFWQDASLLQVICLTSVVGESADHDALVNVVHFVDLCDYSLADDITLQEEVVLATEERVEVDEAKVVLVSKRQSQSSSLVLIEALDADHHLGVAVLEVLDEIGDGVFGTIEQQSLGEFAEEMAHLVLLDVGLDFLVALQGLLSIHCSYIT